MVKKKIAVLIGSLQAAAAWNITAAWNIKGKSKEKLKYVEWNICSEIYHYLTFQISLYLQKVHCNKFKHTWLDKTQINCLIT